MINLNYITEDLSSSARSAFTDRCIDAEPARSGYQQKEIYDQEMQA